MAKGSTCPNCGEQTFHAKPGNAVLVCSTCGAVGWGGKGPLPPGGGKGSTCKICGSQTVRTIATLKGVSIRYCYTCGETHAVA